VCRGVKGASFALCYRCQSHRERSEGLLADVVVPIAYSPRTGQHHYNLRAYKASPPSRQAQWNILALLLLFLRDHVSCIATAIGGYPTHLATVPSTRGRLGPHPLPALIGTRLGLPVIAGTANPAYGADDREFHTDWFAVDAPAQSAPVRALVLDDTWTTGARAQSFAYALKQRRGRR
jgi:predicted amidophosphoribosyltransferase